MTKVTTQKYRESEIAHVITTYDNTIPEKTRRKLAIKSLLEETNLLLAILNDKKEYLKSKLKEAQIDNTI